MKIKVNPIRQIHRLRRAQQGAAAIEFTFVFLIFFSFFYAMVSYGLVLLLLQGFSFAANEGARAAIAVDPTQYATREDYLDDGVKPRVQEVVTQTLNWLPAKAFNTAVGEGGSLVDVQISELGAIRVSIKYAGYPDDPLIPLLTVPGIGLVPRIPNDLVGESVIAL